MREWECELITCYYIICKHVHVYLLACTIYVSNCNAYLSLYLEYKACFKHAFYLAAYYVCMVEFYLFKYEYKYLLYKGNIVFFNKQKLATTTVSPKTTLTESFQSSMPQSTPFTLSESMTANVTGNYISYTMTMTESFSKPTKKCIVSAKNYYYFD